MKSQIFCIIQVLLLLDITNGFALDLNSAVLKQSEQLGQLGVKSFVKVPIDSAIKVISDGASGGFDEFAASRSYLKTTTEKLEQTGRQNYLMLQNKSKISISR